MVIKLLPLQIPYFWDAIKYTMKAVEPIDPNKVQDVLNETLHALLSDKAQCFVALDKDKRLKGIIITRVIMDLVLTEKYLLFQTMFAWDKISDEEWAEGFNLVINFAKKEECKYISTRSSNPRIWEKAGVFGFKEKYRTFEARL